MKIAATAGCAALFALAAMGSDSCSTETKSTPDSPSSSDRKESASEPNAAKEKSAGVGDSITLTGQEDGSKIAVRVLKIIDPAPGGQYDEAPAGTRYVGVRIRLTNKGTSTYDDAPSNGAALIVTGDEQAETALLTGGPCSIQFATDAKVSPGTRQTGCIPFAVPRGKKPKRFQFTLDSGFGPATGEWALRP